MRRRWRASAHRPCCASPSRLVLQSLAECFDGQRADRKVGNAGRCGHRLTSRRTSLCSFGDPLRRRPELLRFVRRTNHRRCAAAVWQLDRLLADAVSDPCRGVHGFWVDARSARRMLAAHGRPGRRRRAAACSGISVAVSSADASAPPSAWVRPSMSSRAGTFLGITVDSMTWSASALRFRASGPQCWSVRSPQS